MKGRSRGRGRAMTGVSIVLALGLLIAACGQDPTDEPPEAAADDEPEPAEEFDVEGAGDITVAFVSHVMDITDTYGQMLEGLREALDDYFGDNYRLLTAAARGSDDLEGMDRILSDLATIRPDYALIGLPAYEVAEPRLIELQEVGTKVLVSEYAPDFLEEVNLEPLTWVTYSHYVMGYEGGWWIGEHYCEQDRDFTVAIFWGLAASEISDLRGEGFLDGVDEAIADCGISYEVVEQVYADFDREQAFNLAETVAIAHPDVDVAVGMNSNTALGMMEGFQAAGILDRVNIVGMGGQLDEAAAICRGDIRVAAVRDARDMGRLAAEAIWLDTEGSTEEIPEVSLIPLPVAHDCESVFAGMPLDMLSEAMFRDNIDPGQWEEYAE